MKLVGSGNIVIGIVMIVIGLAAGIVSIVSGAHLLKRKSKRHENHYVSNKIRTRRKPPKLLSVIPKPFNCYDCNRACCRDCFYCQRSTSFET